MSPPATPSRTRRRRFWRRSRRARSASCSCSAVARAADASRNAASTSVRSRGGLVAPFERGLQAGAAVQVVLGSTGRVPGLRGRGHHREDASALGVLLEPRCEARPCRRERLVRHLDRLGPGAHEARLGEHREHLVARGIRSQVLRRHPPADRAAIGSQRHQSKEDPAARHPLVGVHRLVETVGGLRDRARDAAGRLVAGDRERGALAAEPGLDERVRQVGECAGLARGIPEDDLGEAGLEPQAGTARRLLDGLAQRRRRHRADEVDALRDERGEVGMRRRTRRGSRSAPRARRSSRSPPHPRSPVRRHRRRPRRRGTPPRTGR